MADGPDHGRDGQLLRMIEGRRVLAIVPARGGSKEIPLKNLRLVGGVPLVSLVARVVNELPEIDRTVVSTDHDEIARVAEAAGLGVPFRRPPELSGDRIGDVPVLSHGLRATEALDRVQYDIVVMLQPTSPLRTPAEVRDCLSTLAQGDYDAVWTVSPTSPTYHPLKQLRIGPDGQLHWYDERGKSVVARQELETLYHRNGVAYALTRECLLKQGTLLGRRSRALVLPARHVSVDSEEDLVRVEALMGRVAG